MISESTISIIKTEAELIKDLLEILYREGVKEVVLTPGSRNAPLIAAFEASLVFNLHFWGEERSAAFFALGKIKAQKRPVAIVTTSGTAVGELFPAVMEAHYIEAPLILITADRPRRFRGTNAPQCAEQKEIFGYYTKTALDIAAGEAIDLEAWNKKSPLHLNICLEDPKKPLYIEGSWHFQENMQKKTSLFSRNDLEIFERFLKKTKAPLVVVGTLEEEDKETVANFLLKFGAPLWLESTSRLREDKRLAHLRLEKEKHLLESAFMSGYDIDAVIAIGGVPTIRFWRDLEHLSLPVLTLSKSPFPGLTKSFHIQTSLSPFLKEATISRSIQDPTFFLEQEKKFLHQVESLLEFEKESEPSLVYKLSSLIGEKATIFLGNSLPIREWDLFATRKKRHDKIFASRGLNGIEGQVSTFLGVSEKEEENWTILGDQTLLYDLAGFWGCKNYLERALRFVVINNGGGKIFERMFSYPSLENRHKISFLSLAQFWGLDYACWRAIPECAGHSLHTFIEIIPEEKATHRFWKEYEALCGRQ